MHGAVTEFDIEAHFWLRYTHGETQFREAFMRNLLVGGLVLILGAAMVHAVEPTDAAVEGAPELEKVKKAKFAETYVNPEVDFTRYNKVYLGDAHFDYRDVGPAEKSRSMHGSSSKSVFGISDADRDKFEKVVDEAFMKEMGKAKNFEISDTLDANTMIMRGAVVDIVSRVPPEFAGRSEVYLAAVGEATLVLEFLDGKTGEVLARIAERRTLGRPGGQIDMMSMPTNSVTVWSDVRRWATSSAKRLSSVLDAAMSGK
jgi:hypothetical protein